MHKHFSYIRKPYYLYLAFAVLVLFVSVNMAGTAKAATAQATKTNSNISGSVTQSYNANSTVQLGMIVGLKSKSSDTVIPSSSGDSKNILGVVVPAANATIVLTPQHVTTQQVLVSTVGNSQVLVSNQNGPIKVGDYIAISSVNGIGMKADSSQPQVIGKANSSFSGSNEVIGTVKVQSKLGKSATVAIGHITVNLNVSHNPMAQTSAFFVPSFLGRVANNVANKQVSIIRIYLSLALLIMTAFVTANMLYAGVRGSIVAIGRNPLSKRSIVKGLTQTVITGLAVFIAGVFAVYLLLKL